jgi:hypothetical protein
MTETTLSVSLFSMRFVLRIIIVTAAAVISGCGAGTKALGERDDQSVENRKRSLNTESGGEDEDFSDSYSGSDNSRQDTRASSRIRGTPAVRLQNPYRKDYPADFESLFRALAHKNVIWNGNQVTLRDQIINSGDFKKVYESMMPTKGTSAYMQLVPRASQAVPQGCDIAYMRLVHLIGSTLGTDYIYFVDVAYAGSDPTLMEFDQLMGRTPVPERKPSLGFDLKRDQINNERSHAVAPSIASTIATEAHGCPISGIRVGKMEKWRSIKIHPYVTYEATP